MGDGKNLDEDSVGSLLEFPQAGTVCATATTDRVREFLTACRAFSVLTLRFTPDGVAP